MHRVVMTVLLVIAAGTASAQGLGPLDAVRGAFADQTPEQRRAFCGRVAQAAAGCGTIEMPALSACLIRTLPAQDSARVARVANATRGNIGGLMQECGISFGR